MTTLLHISDLHFGRTDPRLIEDILKEIHNRAPDLVIISGDFTQNGLHDEFRQARQFVRRIAAPVFSVPGNHDMPRYNLYERFVRPFARYRDYINEQTDPYFENDAIAIVGMNTARPAVPHWNWAHGMVSKAQLVRAEAVLAAIVADKCRIFVCHHPLLAVNDRPIDTIVWRSQATIEMLVRQKVDVVLSGHIHHASVTRTGADKALMFVGAGTATSTRLRRQTNGYNFLTIGRDEISVELYDRRDDAYRLFETQSVRRRAPSVQAAA